MRKIEQDAAKFALKSSTNNEPVWVSGFIFGVEYYAKLFAKDAQGIADRATKQLKNEDPEKPFSEQEKKDLSAKIEMGRLFATKALKTIEEEID